MKLLYYITQLIMFTTGKSFSLRQVDIFFSLGDSLTAGFGILNNEFSKLDEYRGLSGFAGCDSNPYTLPNLIMNFTNKPLYGCSKGQHLAEICYGYLCPPFQHRDQDFLNVAQSGAMVLNLDNQLDYLISQFKQIDNWENKNKLGTLVIGANDVCILSTTNYHDSLTLLFQKIEKIPNLVLLVYPFFHISGIVNLSKQNKGCSTVNHVLGIECPDAFILNNSHNMDKQMELLNKALLETKSSNSIIKDIFMNKDISNAPPYFISLVDCFHISLQAHQALSINMWNSLFSEIDMDYFAEPVKGEDIDFRFVSY